MSSHAPNGSVNEGAATEALPSLDSLAGARPSVADGPPRLLALSGPLVGQQFLLDEEITTIGRGGDSTICIKEPCLSRVHAGVHRTPSGSWVVRDEGSKNGTYVNGQHAAEHELGYGDRIEVGTTTLLFTPFNPIEEESSSHVRTMEMLGRLGAGVAHEFNNLLAVLVSCQGYLATLPRDTPLGDRDVSECLEDMSISVRRASELTGRLLGVAQRGGQGFGCLDLGRVCREVLELVRRTTPRSITVTHAISQELLVAGSRSHLHQMILNLCVNARDAMPDGGTLHLSAKHVEGRDCEGVPNLSGPQVQITVSDTGIGMDESTKKKLFEPFFTTKPAGTGTGLGLATVLESVGYHGGQITFDSAPNQGTSFHVFLPAVQGLSEEDETVRGVEPYRGATAVSFRRDVFRVLVVDDDASVRRGTGRLLASLGYLVSYAANGQEGLDRYAADRPDAVLLDLDMSGMSGVATCEKLKELDDDARVIFISGHWDAEATLAREGSPPFLQKPCTGNELHRALQLAISGSSLSTSTSIPTGR